MNSIDTSLTDWRIMDNNSNAYCRNCGNTGIGWQGVPCECRRSQTLAPQFPPRPKLTEEERQAEYERLDQIARDMEEKRRIRRQDLKRSDVYQIFMKLWMEYKYERLERSYTPQLEFLAFMDWLERLERDV